MFFNPETEEQISYQDLCKKYNASIPFSRDVYDGWFKIFEGTMPEVNEYTVVKDGPIELVGSRYCKTYVTENKPLEEVKEIRLQQLAKLFENANNESWLVSSLGFKVDANATANRDVQGLVTVLEATGMEKVSFCDYENNFHELTLAEIKTLQLEIIQQAQSLYAQKWIMRTAIESAETVENVIAIEFHMTYKDFSTGEDIVIA